MNPDDRANAIAARIADGSAIDWSSAAPEGTDPDEQATLDELRSISALATLHRAPSDWAEDVTTRDGASWGPLQITSKIGEGRFGQVYLAWDARLQRRVALKLLNVPSPAASASSSHAIEEARLLARVRHPNVLAVYGAECVKDRIGIWTEYIEGRTLEDLLREQGPRPPADVAAIGLDLCRALGAVHDAGLLHRDIKLQNVMRETGGRIVLMDFGTGLDLEVKSARAGDMSGTPLYLAPEILAGGTATQASDVYALAVLLFRLLTGEYPVQGKTLDDVRSGHQRRSAARLRDARPDLPSQLVEAIERGLARDPSQRHQTVQAFEAALTQDHAAISPRGSGIWRVVSRGLAGRLVAGFAVLALVGAWTMNFAGLRDRLRSAAPVAAVALWETRPLTINGDAAVADISSDGKLIAYIRPTDRSLWIRSVDTGEDRLILPADSSDTVWGATLTPDGVSIDVVKAGGDLWRVPLSGDGAPRRIAAAVRSPPGWAPDGTRMALIRATGSPATWRLVIADAEGRAERELSTAATPLSFVGRGYAISPSTNRPAWSPDGRMIAIAGLNLSTPAAYARVILIDVDTGAQRDAATTEQKAGTPPVILQMAWLDQMRLAVNAQVDGQGPYQISILDVTNQVWAPVTSDYAVYKGVSFAGARGHMVTTRVEERTGIWIGDGSGQGMSISMPESRARPQDGSFDAEGNFVYSTDTPDGSTVWVLGGGETTPRFVARGASPVVPPAGAAVVFVDVADRPGLYRAALDGSGIHQLTSGPVGKPALSPDGLTVFFIAIQSSGQSVWAVPLAGGTPRRVANRFGVVPSVSPDGRRLLFVSHARNDATQRVFLVCDLPDCTSPQELANPAWARQQTTTWTPDGRGVAFASWGVGAENIWVQPLDGGPVWQLTHFADDRTIVGFSWSPDGSRLAVTRGATVSDAVLLTRGR